MGISRDRVTQDARALLATGKMAGSDSDAIVAACDRLVRIETERSSASAIKLGRKFVRVARKLGKDASLTALRSLGWAYLVGGKYRQARDTYLEARSLATRLPEIRARIDRVLIDVYMYLGDFTEAKRRAEASLKTLKRIGAKSEIAKTEVNFANLLHRQDRHREAHKLYHRAGKFFKSRGEDLAAAFCYYNEANTLVQFFDFKPATALYNEARTIFLRHGHSLRANGCQYGLAWLHMLEGNYHIALRELAECESEYRNASQPREVVLCQLDRAEAFLGLNLFADARMAARSAEKSARSLGVKYEAAKAALFFAKASLAMGKSQGARKILERARQGFAGEHNQPFLAAADLVEAQLEGRGRDRRARIQSARKKFTDAQLPLWEAICDFQYLSEWANDESALTRLASNPAVKTVPHLLARHRTMLGDREAAAGRRQTAIRHWKKAADVLDAVRAKLPPVDMRSSFTKHRIDPHHRLVESELKTHPIRSAAWSERLKTAGLWAVSDESLELTPVRQKAERSLAELAQQVTVLSGQLGSGDGHREMSAIRQSNELTILQKRVRDDLAALERRRHARTDPIESIESDILAVSTRQPVVQLYVGQNDIIAYVHDRRQTKVRRLPGGVTVAHEYAARWRFLLERAPFLAGKPSLGDIHDEQILLSQIGEWLWAPLDIPTDKKQILVIPEGELSNLPWQAIVHRGRPLVEQHELVIAPSIRHYLHARGQKTRSADVRVFVGATEGIETPREFETLLERAGDRATLCSPCTRRDWPDNSQAHLWHYAGHAEYRRDNPFYSSLMLDDGPLFAADFRLKHNTVNLVTLAACRTGQLTQTPGEEATGLVRSLLEMGARNVIASHWAVYDRSAVSWMSSFYRTYLGGAPISRAARQAALETRAVYPLTYHWAAFSVFGAGS